MTITAHRIRRYLAELNAWLPLLDEQARPSLHSTHPETASTSAQTRGLPFNLDRAINNTDDGEAGVRTSAGVYEILQSWANQFAEERCEVRPLWPITNLHGLADWAAQHPDWESFAETVSNLRNHVAGLVGYADQQIGTCPRCGGRILATPDRDGLPEWGTCNTCDTWYADQADIARQRHQHYIDTLRTITDCAYYVQLQDILEAYPCLTKEQVMKWKQRGKVTYHPDHGYNISQINDIHQTIC